MLAIRAFAAADWPSLWPMLRATFAAGDTYAYAPDSSERDIHAAWIEAPLATFVACTPDGCVVGSYCLKPNQPGLGAHVCNCGYVVAAQAEGRGIASAMCVHSQHEAVSRGFRAMQFNLVVSTNERALRLWQRLGFAIVGRLPGAFRHCRIGYVDALVMYKSLIDADADADAARPTVGSAAHARPATAAATRPLSLLGAHVRLRPLQRSDADALVAAASDGELWNLPFAVVPSAANVHDHLDAALEDQAGGTCVPWAIELRSTGRLVGSTGFRKIDHRHRQLEIGGTWIAASWQRSFVHTEAKLLMLDHAFERWGCVRVQFTTDETDGRSRAAILRLGARQEGIVRHERVMPDGRKRNSVRFSILDEEWPRVRQSLQARLLAHSR